MSSNELQGTIEKQEKEIDYNGNIMHFLFDQLNLQPRSLPTELQSKSSDELNEMKYKPPTSFAPLFECHPLASNTEQYQETFMGVKEVKKFIEILSRKTALSSASDLKIHDLSTPKKKKYVFQKSAAASKKNYFKCSNNKTPTLKDFPKILFDLPLTKHKLDAASLSLEEKCGFLPILIRTKRNYLLVFEQQLDQISVELQKALRNSQAICIKLKNALSTVPTDIDDLAVQAEKLMYLLSSSFRIFQKLDRCGLLLKECLQAYSEVMVDFHISVDFLLEDIMKNIFEKCWLKQK